MVRKRYQTRRNMPRRRMLISNSKSYVMASEIVPIADSEEAKLLRKSHVILAMTLSIQLLAQVLAR